MKRDMNRKKQEREMVFVDRSVWVDNKTYTFELVQKIIEKHEFQMVEISDTAKRDDILIKAVVWNENGIDISDLVRISKDFMRTSEEDEILVKSKISEVLRLDLSSPGIDRVFKSNKEFEIFKGLDILISLTEILDDKETFVCKNLGIDNGKLKVNVGDELIEIDTELIKNVRLAG